MVGPALLARGRRWARDCYIRAKHVWREMRGIAPGERVKFYWFETRNFGDALNPIIIRWLSGKHAWGLDLHCEHSGWSPAGHTEPIYLVIGSTLAFADGNTIVWGAGFLSGRHRFRQPPRRICAVRGPLSRQIVLSQGLVCPDVYGDPVLLYPRIYTPARKRTYKLGIVPHYADRHCSAVVRYGKIDGVKIVDVKRDPRQVIDAICSCECVASSSLHGLIAADAYGVPSVWVSFGDRVLGDGFKFRDYFASVGRDPDTLPIDGSNSTVQGLLRRATSLQHEPNVSALYDTCPLVAGSLPTGGPAMPVSGCPASSGESA